MDINKLLEKLCEKNLYQEPFPHIIINDFLPTDVFTQLAKSFPKKGFNHDVQKNKNKPSYRKTIQIIEKDQLKKYDKIWKNIYKFFSDKKYIEKVYQVFGREVSTVIKKTEMQIIFDKTNYQILPHCDANIDSKNKKITSLFYMPEEGTPNDIGTEFYVPDKNGKIKREDGDYRSFVLKKKVEYKPNTLVIFLPNYPVTWHGVSKIHYKNIERKSLQIFHKKFTR